MGKVSSQVMKSEAWRTWSPTWANCVVSNSTVHATYIQLGKTVIARLEVIFSSTDKPSGAATFTLPVARHADYQTYEKLGTATFFDANGQAYDGMVSCTATNNIVALRTNCSGGVAGAANYSVAISGTSPMTWTAGDMILVNLRYEAA